MATFTIISQKEAPEPPRSVSAMKQQSEQIITSLSKGQVARVEPEGDETVRSLRISLSRMSKEQGKSVQIWDVDGIVYVKLT